MVRNSELNAARRGAADKARARQQVRSQMTGTLVGIDPEDSRRVIVSFDGSEVSVLAGPDKLVPGSLVAVEVDALGAPVRVLGAVTVRPAGLDEGMPAPLPVVAMPELAARELTDAEYLAIIETEQGLADARADLEDARTEAEANFGTLNDKLGQAFPTDIFDVGAALGAVEVDVLAQAALDAQGMATDAQQAAIQAAQAFAAGEISEAELRAANDAQARANAARDAAIDAAELDATSKAGQALAGAQAYAEQQAQAAQDAAAQDAQGRATAAQEAAIQAAAEHADLVAQGASQDAIDAAAQDAQAKADAAQAAAEAHAEAQAAAAETAAKTHATNEAARVKQEALTEAATDALSKANTAASAAQAAAEQYALAQAQGLSGAALTAAKAHAEAQAQAAQAAAETAAEAYADAARNAAIDAAALTAQTKADVAKQGAIDAARADLDALEVGGRNYMLNSAQPGSPFVISANNNVNNPTQQGTDEIGQWITGTSASSGLFYISTYTNPTFANGRGSVFSGGFYPLPDYFVQSIEVMSEHPVTVGIGSYGAKTTLTPGEWTQISSYVGPGHTDFYRGRMWGLIADEDAGIPVGAKVYHRNWKLERGTKATDWSPAPEDVDAGIAGAIDEAAITAQSKADAAQEAAIQAAAEHADLVAQGASQDAIDAAAQDAQAKADAAQAAAIAAAKADLDALEVGGRNLIRSSVRNKTSATYMLDSMGLGERPPLHGETVTISIKGELGADRTHFQVYNSGGYVDVYPRIFHSDRGPDGVYRVSLNWRVELDGGHVADNTFMRIYQVPSSGASESTIEWVKLERGTKSTDWTPAPEDVDAGITAATTAASQAMTTADGKNTTTYKDVTTTPGPAPTNAVEGKNRRQFDMHRNRLSNGTIVGEWMWSGTSWVQVHMGDGILRSLDVGKLTAGTANIETTVANKLWAGLAVVQRLQVEQSAYIDGVNLKDGAVTARTLNVVPESGTGGMELLPPGLRIIPSDAEAGTAVSLRTDENNWLTFAKGKKSTFSVNSDGHLTAQQVDANESLTYRTVELADLLSPLPRGVIARSKMIGNTVTIGTDEGRIVFATFRVPPENRLIKLSFNGRLNEGSARFMEVNVRQSTGNSVKPTNSSKKTWPVDTRRQEAITLSDVFTVTEWGWVPNETITVGIFAKSLTASQTARFVASHGQELIIEDVGAVVGMQEVNAWAPSTGGGSGGSGGENDTKPRDYTYQRKSSWVRSFLDDNTHYNYGAGRAYQGLQPGTNNGNLKSMIGWPSLISTLNGANIKSIKVRIKNDHTYAYSGGTAYIGLHGRTAVPATFAHSVSSVLSASFTRGQTRTLTIPSQYHAGFKNGDYTGITLYTGVSSNARYGYWDGANCELIIEYEK